MFVRAGARNLLLQSEREKFLGEEWPRIYATIQRLGLKAEELMDAAKNGRASADTAQSKTGKSDSTEPKSTEEER
jgi:hypothetical protein